MKNHIKHNSADFVLIRFFYTLLKAFSVVITCVAERFKFFYCPQVFNAIIFYINSISKSAITVYNHKVFSFVITL